jgi:hypothetical protein
MNYFNPLSPPSPLSAFSSAGSGSSPRHRGTHPIPGSRLEPAVRAPSGGEGRFDTYSVEVVPAFLLTNGRYWICNTNDGGSYKETDPWAEVGYINTVNQANNGNLRPLIRMLKAWQAYCSVPIKSFQLELLAADFISKSPWRLYDFFWFDWITRDFFLYLYHRANTFISVPGTLETIHLGNDWQSRAESAYWRPVKACDHEQYNRVDAAGEEWQKIFGSQIPRTI